MKMHKTVILIVAILKFGIVLAQDVDMMLFDRDVNGVKIGVKMTKEQVVDIFGEPDKYVEQDSGDNGVNKFYYYGKSFLHFKNDAFDEFYIVDTDFVALTNHIDGGLKVGDSISKLDSFKYGKPRKQKNGSYKLFFTSDNPVYLWIEDGIIIGIEYNEPI